MQEKGAMPEGEVSTTREYHSMHENNFLSSWLREDPVETAERRKVNERVREEEGKKGKERRKGKETVRKKRSRP